MTEPNTHETITNTNYDSSSNISHSLSSSSLLEDIKRLKFSISGYPESFSLELFDDLKTERRKFPGFIDIKCKINFDNVNEFRPLSDTDNDTVNNEIIREVYGDSMKCSTCYLPRSLHKSSTPKCGFKIENGDFPPGSNRETPNGYCRACLMKSRVCLVGDHIRSDSQSQSLFPVIHSQEVLIRLIKIIEIKNDQEAEFLTYEFSDSFKNMLLERYNSLPDKIYIRKSYKDLYDLIFPLAQETHSSTVTGVPGIGKSTFLFYILYNFLESSSVQNKSFTLSFGLQKCISLHPLGNNKFLLREFKNYCPDRDFKTQLFIFDSLFPEYLPIEVVSNWDVVLASPNPVRYKYVPGLTYYMPVWTFEELEMLQPDSTIWENLYNKYGGVPRYLFRSQRYTEEQFLTYYDEKFSTAIREKTMFIIENFTIYGHHSQQGQEDAKKNHMLVHLNPLELDNGTILYTSYTEFFASEYSMRKLKSKYQDIFYKKAVSMLNSGKMDILKEFDLNMVFQDLFTSDGIPVYNKRYTIKLLPLNSQKSFDLSFASSSMTFYNLSDLEYFELNKLYISTNSRFKSLDAFYVNCGVFYGFQCTTANAHPLNSRGLLEFRDFFREKNITINTYYLIFVVPHKTEKIETIQSYDRKTEIKRITERTDLTDEVKETMVFNNGRFLNTILQATWAFEFNNKRKQDESSLNLID